MQAKLYYLQDCIFKGLPKKEVFKFQLQFNNVIKAGADTTKVVPNFIIWSLADEKHGVYQYANDDGKAAIETVVNLCKRQLNGELAPDEEWDAAKESAHNAACAAARLIRDNMATGDGDGIFRNERASLAARAVETAIDSARSIDRVDIGFDLVEIAELRAENPDAECDTVYLTMGNKLLELLAEAR